MKTPDLKRLMAFEKIVAKNFPELKKDTCSQTILRQKKVTRDHLSDVKIHYKVVRILTMCYWPRDREVDQCNKFEGFKLGYMAAQCIAEMV